MAASRTLETLSTIFPAFEQAWQKSDFNTEDETDSAHGVLAEFSHFYLDHYQSFSPGQLQQLSWALNQWFEGGDPELENAVATCFLENVAGEAGIERLHPLLKESARRFLRER